MEKHDFLIIWVPNWDSAGKLHAGVSVAYHWKATKKFRLSLFTDLHLFSPSSISLILYTYIRQGPPPNSYVQSVSHQEPNFIWDSSGVVVK